MYFSLLIKIIIARLKFFFELYYKLAHWKNHICHPCSRPYMYSLIIFTIIIIIFLLLHIYILYFELRLSPIIVIIFSCTIFFMLFVRPTTLLWIIIISCFSLYYRRLSFFCSEKIVGYFKIFPYLIVSLFTVAMCWVCLGLFLSLIRSVLKCVQKVLNYWLL